MTSSDIEQAHKISFKDCSIILRAENDEPFETLPCEHCEGSGRVCHDDISLSCGDCMGTGQGVLSFAGYAIVPREMLLEMENTIAREKVKQRMTEPEVRYEFVGPSRVWFDDLEHEWSDSGGGCLTSKCDRCGEIYTPSTREATTAWIKEHYARKCAEAAIKDEEV